MARTSRKRPRKTITLDRFLKHTSIRNKTSSSQEEKKEEKNKVHTMGIMGKRERRNTLIDETGRVEERIKYTNKERGNSIVVEEKAGEGKGEGVDIINDLLEALLVSRKKAKREESREGQRQKMGEKKKESSRQPCEESIIGEETGKTISKAVEDKNILGEIKIPKGEIIDRILQEGISPELTVCNSKGECNDGKRLGEYFVDQFGFKRQRGFVRTTRTPIFTDWIVEEAVVSRLLPRAFKLETNRDALAIVPEDFICELQARYGVVLKNFDACKGYQVSLTGTVSKSRKKK